MNKTLFILLLTALLFSSSCKKDGSSGSNNNNNNNVSSGTITAKLDGQDFSWDATGTLASFTSPVELTQFSIIGTSPDETFGFIITVLNNADVTTTSYGPCAGVGQDPDVCVILSYSNSAQENYVSNPTNSESVSIEFSSIDFRNGGSAEGTFSANLETGLGQTIIVTEGKFNIDIL